MFYKKVKQNQLKNKKPISEKCKVTYVTLSINTDGISVSKSTIKSHWSVFIVINKLPMDSRYKTENVILAGVFCFKTKPKFEKFLNPIIESLKKLEGGFRLLRLENTDPREICEVYLITICADKPAKSGLTNTVQYNGMFGCPYCKNPGKSLERRWVYSQTGTMTLKTSIGYNQNQNSASAQNPFLGIKGPSLFESLACVEHYKSFVIDYMHSVILGVGKKILSCYFDKKFKNEPFSLLYNMNEIDNILQNLNYPQFVPRECRDIFNYEKWKANQIRTFFLYVAVPLLESFIRPILVVKLSFGFFEPHQACADSL